MKVKVEYLGTMMKTLNRKEEIIEVPMNTTLQELLCKLSNTHGKWFKEEILESDGEKIREGFIVTVNGIATGQTGGLQTILMDGDEIALLPFFAGGG